MSARVSVAVCAATGPRVCLYVWLIARLHRKYFDLFRVTCRMPAEMFDEQGGVEPAVQHLSSVLIDSKYRRVWDTRCLKNGTLAKLGRCQVCVVVCVVVVALSHPRCSMWGYMAARVRLRQSSVRTHVDAFPISFLTVCVAQRIVIL